MGAPGQRRLIVAKPWDVLPPASTPQGPTRIFTKSGAPKRGMKALGRVNGGRSSQIATASKCLSRWQRVPAHHGGAVCGPLQARSTSCSGWPAPGLTGLGSTFDMRCATRSARSWSGLSVKCAYLSVVRVSAWPKAWATKYRLAPSATAKLAKLWRRSSRRRPGCLARSLTAFQALLTPAVGPVPREAGNTCGLSVARALA